MAAHTSAFTTYRFVAAHTSAFTTYRFVAAHAGARRATMKRLAKPKRAAVLAGAQGRPESVDGREVEAVRESWLVEDRWWTPAPVRRRYWEVVTVDGRDLVVFRDLVAGEWYRQR